MKNVLLIDPAANGKKIASSSYNNGLIDALSKHCNLTLAATADYELGLRNIKVLKCFFKYSNKMKRGRLRSFIRLLEYIFGYITVISDVFMNQYDIIHIQWFFCYPIDIIFLKLMKKKVINIVYTAHNVYPHVDGEKQIEWIKQIYSLVDKILVHGEAIKKEFEELFPDLVYKVYIQRHGEYFGLNTNYDRDLIDKHIIEKVEMYELVLLFSGNIFYNKGIDRLAKIWIDNFDNYSALLVITGGQAVKYDEYDRLKSNINNCNNILCFDEFVDENLFNYIASKSDIMILPYRHASMSAVVFTAACFEKTILSTRVGAISEYLDEGVDSLVCEPDDKSLYIAIKDILDNYKREKLEEMGILLGKHIHEKYSWNTIAKFLLESIY